MKQDTIAAIATPMMSSGIGIVRISGEAAFSIIEEIFRPKNSEKQMTVQQIGRASCRERVSWYV